VWSVAQDVVARYSERKCLKKNTSLEVKAVSCEQAKIFVGVVLILFRLSCAERKQASKDAQRKSGRNVGQWLLGFDGHAGNR